MPKSGQLKLKGNEQVYNSHEWKWTKEKMIERSSLLLNPRSPHRCNPFVPSVILCEVHGGTSCSLHEQFSFPKTFAPADTPSIRWSTLLDSTLPPFCFSPINCESLTRAFSQFRSFIHQLISGIYGMTRR